MAKQAAVAFSHWFHLLEGLQESPQSFYATLEEAIKKRELPEVSLSRIDYHEGSVLSANREYVRVRRTGYVFDICAAPFGKGFFVSWWLGKTVPAWGFWALFAGMIFSIFAVLVAIHFFGFVVGVVAFIAVVGLVLAVLADQLRTRGYSLEDVILSFPLLGTMYERFFQPNTFYRIDTTLMFQESVHCSVLEVVDQLTNSKGIRALSELERKPILRDVFRR